MSTLHNGFFFFKFPFLCFSSSAASPSFDINTTKHKQTQLRRTTTFPWTLMASTFLCRILAKCPSISGAYTLHSARNMALYFIQSTIVTRATNGSIKESKYQSTKFKVPASCSQIAVMDPALHSPLAERPAAVPVTPPVTCRLWVKRVAEFLKASIKFSR